MTSRLEETLIKANMSPEENFGTLWTAKRLIAGALRRLR